MQTATQSKLRAGAAKADISPAMGIQIAGDIGRNRPCTGVREPIYARALVVEKDGKQFCVVSMDVLAIDTPWADEVRWRVQKSFAISPDAVMLHATQTHSAPSIGNHMCRDSCKIVPEKYPWLRGGDARYNEPAVAGVMKAIGDAIERLVPVDMAAGRAVDGRVGFNRRYVMRDGTSLCQPKMGDPNILHVEGPADPEVGVVTFTGSDGRVVGALLHYTSHPCNGFWKNEAFPDWPGDWCNEMEAHFGASCTALVINGCCGNIIHYNYLDPNQPQVEDPKKIGRLLAESAKRALEHMSPVEPSAFAWISTTLPIPRRVIPDEVLAKSKQLLKDHPEPVWKDEIRVTWEWVYAVGIIDIAEERTTQPDFPYEIQAMRIGDFSLLGLGGEPFVEAQLHIKKESPFAFTQIAHMCNGFVGYVPTRRAFTGGGYETNIGRGSRLDPAALELIQDASVSVLKNLHAVSHSLK